MGEYKILVLEDDELFRETLASALEDADYDVSTAANAEEAVGLADKSPFDLVVTDIRMAGKDGLEAVQAIKGKYPDMRSIVITGYATVNEPVRAVKIQVDDYLYKPFEISELIESIKRVMGTREEKKRYSGLKDSLRSALQKIKSAVGLKKEAPLDLDSIREKTITAFYVGIRTGRLNLHSALQVWDSFEFSESERELWLRGEKDDKVLASLVDSYNASYDLIVELMLHERPVRMERDKGKIDLDTFANLYHKVSGGEITREQFKLAPFLRFFDPAMLQETGPWYGIYHRVWGEGKKEESRK